MLWRNIIYISDHTTNMVFFSPSQVQILKSSSTCWPTLRANGSMISGCLFLHCQGYRMEVPHQHLLLQRWMQATCVTWSPKSRLALYIAWCRDHCGDIDYIGHFVPQSLTCFFADIEHVQQYIQPHFYNIITMNLIFLPQGSRMDEQRCSVTPVSTPSAQHKDHPISDSSDKHSQMSASLNRAKTDQNQQVGCHATLFRAHTFPFYCPVNQYSFY